MNENEKINNLECDENLVVSKMELPTTDYELLTKEKDINYYKKLCVKLKDESVDRKSKFNELFKEKAELEDKLKNHEEYKSMIEQKEQEINKLRNEFEPVSKEVEQLRALKAEVEQREKTRRENLINQIKNISEHQKNDSYIVIAEALTDNEKLELFLKNISSAEEKKIPVYSSKPGPSPKPAGEAINLNSITDLQRLFNEDRERYNELIARRL